MVDRMTRLGTSVHATIAEAAALVAVSEAFAASWCGREVLLENVAARAQYLVEAEEDGPLAAFDSSRFAPEVIKVLAATAGELIVDAAEQARKVWP